VTFEDPAAQRAARRSGALAGIGLLWVALLASLGLLWAALGAVAATAVGILAVLVGTWRPHLDAGAALARAHRRLASAGTAAGRALGGARRSGGRALAHVLAGLRGDAAALRRWSHRGGAAVVAGSRRDAAALRRWSHRGGAAVVAGSRRDAVALRAWSRRATAATAVQTRAAAGTSRRLAAAGSARARDGKPRLPHLPHLPPLASVATSARGAAATLARAPDALGGLRPRPGRTRASGHRLAHESVRRRREGDVDEAVALAREAVTAFRTARDAHGEALALNTLALALAQGHRYVEAVDALDGALRLLAETGDRHREGTVLVNLGTLHRQAGGVESARFCWRKALERLDPASPESRETERLLRAS
jgi:tetratricopeptide (TPR) repeat protein